MKDPGGGRFLGCKRNITSDNKWIAIVQCHGFLASLGLSQGDENTIVALAMALFPRTASAPLAEPHLAMVTFLPEAAMFIAEPSLVFRVVSQCARVLTREKYKSGIKTTRNCPTVSVMAYLEPPRHVMPMGRSRGFHDRSNDLQGISVNLYC